MKKIILLAMLILSAAAMVAQQTYKNWHEIDMVTIYQPLQVADYSTLYLLPVDQSEVEFEDSDKNKTEQVLAQLAAFRQILQAEIELQIPGLKVALVDEVPANLQNKEMALKLTISEFDMGSRAARVWLGFGAGRAAVQLRGHLTDSRGATILDFKHRRLSASMKDYPAWCGSSRIPYLRM